jgi:hypothetical protein
MKAQIDGKDIPLPELAKIILQQYKYYARTGQKTLRDDKLLPPQQIDIE